MTNNDLAKHIAQLRKRQGRLLKETRHQLDQLEDVNANLCAALCDASERVQAAGLIDEDAGKLATEPKDL